MWKLRTCDPPPGAAPVNLGANRTLLLKLLGKAEVDSAIEDLGKLEIDCEFCGRHYGFDAVDCAQLFTSDAISDAVQLPGSQQH